MAPFLDPTTQKWPRKKTLDPEAESSAYGRRQHGMARADRCDATFRRGGRGSTVRRCGSPKLRPALKSTRYGETALDGSVLELLHRSSRSLLFVRSRAH